MTFRSFRSDAQASDGSAGDVGGTPDHDVRPELDTRIPRQSRKARLAERQRRRRRRDRRLISETLENRQLLAGPELVGIQPNEGELLVDGSVLSVSPRELTFRFDDDTRLDPSTLGAIRLTRAGDDGIFESASATSDLGTGDVVLEFRSRQSGTIGNGTELIFVSSDRAGSSLPIISVNDQTVTVDLNERSGRETRVGDLISALNANDDASRLVEVFQVSGASASALGGRVAANTTVTLIGANSAEGATDFGTNGDVRVRFVSVLPGVDGRGSRIEFERVNFGGQAAPVVVTTENVVRVQLNSTPGFETTASELIERINNDPDASAVITAVLQEGNAEEPIGASTALADLTLTGVTDVVVEPGYVGLGDAVNEVVFRFAEPLPDDVYQLDILAEGPLGLRGTGGFAFNDGIDFTRRFVVDLGPKVAAVVPEPVRRDAQGQLQQPARGQIDVHFNERLDAAAATNPAFYQLIFTQDTVDNTDDVVRTPTSVTYNSNNNIATLQFDNALSLFPRDGGGVLEGAARLRIGSVDAIPAAPTQISLEQAGGPDIEPGDTLDSALNLTDVNSPLWNITDNGVSSALISSVIENERPFELDLPGPDVAGVRNTRPDDPSRLNGLVPLDYVRQGPDSVDGISTFTYDFASTWLGDDPNSPAIDTDRTYFNSITEQQKQRVRESFELFSQYLGVSFIEIDSVAGGNADYSVAVGDLFGVDPLAQSGDGGQVLAIGDRSNAAGGNLNLVVLDFQDFDESVDDQFGDEFFRGAMFGVGQLLGYGFADDLPQPVTQSTDFVLNPGDDNEPLFPAPVDVFHGQYLYRPDSTDIDLYRFEVDSPGELQIESFAERLPSASLLNTSLRLYQQVGSDLVEVAGNDDYFSNDSYLNLDVGPGVYVLGVSAHGNDSYDPAVRDSGFGGLSQGEYQLRFEFHPESAGSLVDSDLPVDIDGDGDFDQLPATLLDGDGDNRPGGVFNFWFVPANANTTLFVDKAAPAGVTNGSFSNPFREIDQAIAAATPGTTIHVLGNGGADNRIETLEDNLSYQIGFANNGLPLEDGATLELPQGVRMVFDSGAIVKLSRARIGVGSVAPTIDLSDSSLQILGTPSIVQGGGTPVRDVTGEIVPGSVYFTSINDREIGAGNQLQFFAPVQEGDWGGIDFRGDLDSADESRRNREDEGVFLNHIQYGDFRYGGGAVSIGGQQVVVSPIDMAITRPTIINSSITLSADAALAATPDTFAESHFTTERFQAGGAFTLDYDRIGPMISGNFVDENTINGLFVRVSTRGGDQTQALTTTARFDDTDIVHVLTENLEILGTAGGPVLVSDAPSALLVRLAAQSGGSVPAGTYVYRLTNVDGTGLETAASSETVPVTLGATGSVRLTGLPAATLGSEITARRLYRAPVDTATGLPGEFRQVATLNATDTSFNDRAAVGSVVLQDVDSVLRSRLDATLTIDPGSVVKLDGNRIEARFGANLIAEGDPSLPVVLTSLEDQRYGTGGTFDTNDRGDEGEIQPGQWGGIYVGQGALASLDNVVLAGGGGQTRIEGGFAPFNVVEVHQADFRIANSRVEINASGTGDAISPTRVGRGENSAGTVFVRGATPIVVGNQFVDNSSATLSFDVNSFSAFEVTDHGRQTGRLGASSTIGNSGPLIEDNLLDNNNLNGLLVRGGVITTEAVWDDVGMVHIVTDSIEVPNRHIYGGLRLQSDARGSLVVKFQNDSDQGAGIVAGGSLLSAEDEFRDIADRIGGSLQIIGTPDFPVVLTALADDSAGSGFDLDGLPLLDTNNDGGLVDENGVEAGLPTGPEVNQGTLIDNDVDPSIPGFFAFQPGPGGSLGPINDALTTTQGLTQVFANQNPLFDYGNFIDVGADGGAVGIETLAITQQPTLVGNDRVVSEGNFQGENGVVNFRVEQFFENGQPDLVSEISFTSAEPLGDIRFINYYDPIIGTDAGDILFTEGTPGLDDFRLTILDGPEEIGFRQYGTFEPGPGLVGATYEGWIADDFPQLITAPEFNLPFVPEGTVNAANVPVVNDPRFPLPNFGPGILTSALAWLVDPTATSATITTNLEVIAEVFGTSQTTVESGQWNGVTIREGADDRNVGAVVENEATRTAVNNNNDIPRQSQFLGELAPDALSADENQRLGFVIDGAITQRDDVDVYSFRADSGTEVWFDIDKTNHSLDTVVELVDFDGEVLAGSNDSILGESQGSGQIGTSTSLYYSDRLDPDAVLPLTVLNGSEAVQQFTFSPEVSDLDPALNVTLQVGDQTVLVPASIFNADPAQAIENALEGLRVVDSNESLLGNIRVTTFVLPSDELVLQVRFDDERFATSSAPTVSIAATNVSVERQVLRVGNQVQDDYSTNPKDAGFRILLPGEIGTSNIYHVRVRSASSNDPFNSANPGAAGGLSKGNYEFQIRLREQDEHAGTLVQKANIRFAQTGLQVIGGPLHSQLTGEEYEVAGDNDLLADAQPLGFYGISEIGEGNPLASDRLAKAFAGTIDSATDVDFYQFTVNYDYLNQFSVSQYLSTVFDLDYASGLARSDMAIYVFDANGALVLVADDSNVADDLPRTADGGNLDLLSGGSVGTDDPYVGATELSGGTYFVAVANATQVPPQLSQFFDPNTGDPLLRLEPIRSTRRLVEDRIVRPGDTNVVSPEFAEQTVLFDDNSIVPYTLDDLVLYVNTGTNLQLVNPFTGVNYGSVGSFGDEIQEVAFNSDGELFGYSGFGQRPRNDDNWFYYQISPETAQLSAPLSQGAGIETSSAIPAVGTGTGFSAIDADVGLSVEATAIAAFNGAERGYFVANRNLPFDADTIAAGAQYDTNILYEFVPDDGTANGPTANFVNSVNGAATSPREVGHINTDIVDVNGTGSFFNVLGLTRETRLTGGGELAPILTSGDFFTIADLPDNDGARNQVRFEFTTDLTITANSSDIVRDGQQIEVNLGGAQPLTFEFDTGSQIVLGNAAAQGQAGNDLVQPGSTVIIGEGADEVTFEFIRSAQVGPQPGNIPILIVNGANQPLSGVQLATSLAAAINAEFPDQRALASGNEVFFVGNTGAEPLVSESAQPSPGIDVRGRVNTAVDNAGVIPIQLDETITARGLTEAIADAMLGAGIAAVEVSGEQLSIGVDNASATLVSSIDGVDPPVLVSPGTQVSPGSIAISISPADSASDIALKVRDAIDDAPGLNDEVSASLIGTSGGSLQIENGSIVQVGSASGTLVAGGATRGGQVTGVDVVEGNRLYAVTDAGELYVVNFGQLSTQGNRDVGSLVTTATDLIGIPFEGLSVGPSSFQDGELRQILFGITGSGDVYAFNTLGELQPIFAGGESMISTGVGGSRGLDFSNLAFNLWHFTNARGGDAGHGVDATFNGTRGEVAGESSLAFTYEDSAFDRRYLGGEDPDGINQTYNLPGGAKGAVESNVFDLEGYASADQPYLYFNYFLNSDRGDSVDGQVDIDGDGRADGDTDSLRVFVVAEDGTQHIVATNNTARGPGPSDDEFDDPSTTLPGYDDNINVDVQQLFDTTGTWRQARVPLGEFAGQSNLRLRIEFATSGTTTGSASLRAIPAEALIEGQSFTVAGLPFTIDFAPAVTLPSGVELADFYAANPATRVQVSVARYFSDGTRNPEDQVYVLDDGSQTVLDGEIAVSLASTRTGLLGLSAGDVASAFADAVQTATDDGTQSLPGGETLTINAIGSTVELINDGGRDLIGSGTTTGLVAVSGQDPIAGVPVRVTRDMDATAVAEVIQQALFSELLSGDPSEINNLVPRTNSAVRLAGFSLDDPGPFASEGDRYGDQFGGGVLAGAVDNDHEGVYLDDFIIGFAERGEVATGSTPIADQTFVTDTRFEFPEPDELPTGATTGTYTVEIRDASEYVQRSLVDDSTGVVDARFRVFDTNDRFEDGISFSLPDASQIRDGQSFTITNGRNEIRFEFDLLTAPDFAGNGLTDPTAVRVPFQLSVADEVTGQPRPQSGFEIAGSVIEAINRSDVNSVLGALASYSSGADTLGDSTVNLFGEVEINDDTGVLVSIDRTFRRGDTNREREQGVIIVEQSQFAFNADYGLTLASGTTATINGNETNSIVRNPRNLQELNTEEIKPGVVVRSNVLAYNETGGLRIEGVEDTTLSQGNAAVFDRIINNTIVGGVIEAGEASPAETFAGILFPAGQISFADEVIAYLPDADGAQPTPVHRNPNRALGAPDNAGRGAEPIDGQTTVSLGLGGTLTVGFTDNLLTGSGDANPDLVIFETGEIESVGVEISRDGLNYFTVGTVGGLNNEIDLDAFGFGSQDRFSFVRLTDLRQGNPNNAPLGADIDAIGALSSVPVETFTAGGAGITVTGNATPTLLNNVIANTSTAIEFGDNTDIVLGANTFYRNDELAVGGQSLGEFAQVVSDSEVIFARPTDLVFTPIAGAPTIDSSIDSLNDRASLVSVKESLGIAASPIEAPDFDINGLQRIDDTNVEPPSGLGDDVFKDRGADDRGDSVGPRAVLLSPQAPDIGLSAGLVTVSDPTQFFEIQFIDGLAPADVTPGTGIDDSTVNSGSLLLLQDNVPLVEGVDYRFGYNPTDNVIRLTPVAGVWEDNSTYQVRIIDASDAIVQSTLPQFYADGSVLQARTLDNEVVRFEYETGITINVSNGIVDAGTIDSLNVEIFDGVNRQTFEFDNNAASNIDNVPVLITPAGSEEDAAAALADAINASNLNLTARSVGTVVQLNGPNALTTVVASAATLQVDGAIGTSSGFGFQVPTEDGLVSDALADGQTFVIRQGASNVVTFEFDDDGTLDNADAIRVPFTVGGSPDDLAAEIVRLVGGAGLGLSPQNSGFGRVFLGGDQSYSITVDDSGLTQIDLPGQGPTVPILIDISDDEEMVASAIATAIEQAGIAGVTVNQVDTRLFIEGINGVFGVGAVETETVADRVGNQLQSNRSDGRTELTIFIGGGSDYGDAPSPYRSADVEGTALDGPRHGVVEGFSLGATVTAEADALLPNLDLDDGVVIESLRNGFLSNVTVNINAPVGQVFYLDAWFDWNADGEFGTDERYSFGSQTTGRPRVDRGNNTLGIQVPSNAVQGDTFARFRLSGQNGLSPNGAAIAGEVEDYAVTVSANAFQNGISSFDVNASGTVTPIDALQIVNFLRRQQAGSIDLASASLPTNRPDFPDVNGDGRVSPSDALNVINHLRRVRNTPGGESASAGSSLSGGLDATFESALSTYTPVADGVMASALTVLGDAIDTQDAPLATDPEDSSDGVPAIEESPSKVSVFDSPAQIELDSIVDDLAIETAEQTAGSKESGASIDEARDDFFASL